MNEARWLTTDDVGATLAWIQAGRQKGTTTHGNGHLVENVSDRKLRLFACACAWEFISSPTFDPDRRVEILPCIAAAERSADGHLLSKGERPLAMYSFVLAYPDAAQAARETAALIAGGKGAALLREVVGNPFRPVMLTRTIDCDRCNGKGFRVIGRACGTCGGSGRTKGNADWLTPTMLSLARAAYDERLPDGTLDPFRLMVLADALEEAGCAAEEDCPNCFGHGEVLDRRRILRGCPNCGGNGHCPGRGKIHVPHPIIVHLRSPGPHVRGCHVVDLLLGKE